MRVNRIEHDSMGEMLVPASALYGPQTARAIENFPISKLRFPRSFLKALALIKAKAALVNVKLGGLASSKGASIATVAFRIYDGAYDDQFVLDVFQTGSGTSTNMNMNEVIGRLAGVHPNDDVNRSQSSNDVIPTALNMAAIAQVTTQLLPSMRALVSTLTAKATEFEHVVKLGRTHLQDAVPMRLGQEFSGYARQVELASERVVAALDGMYELPIGGTAVGTGLNAPPGFAHALVAELASHTGQPFREASNHFEAQAARDSAVFLSASLRNYALALTKIANDLRWLASGPRGGLGELLIPATQPGSSMMPAKVNPVIAESVLMVCAQIVGYDSAIAWSGASGNFELNTMVPLIVNNLIDSVELLSAGTRNFEARMVRGITANKAHIAEVVEHSLAMVSALVPAVGYDRAAQIAERASAEGRTIRSVAAEISGLSHEELDRLLDPVTQSSPT